MSSGRLAWLVGFPFAFVRNAYDGNGASPCYCVHQCHNQEPGRPFIDEGNAGLDGVDDCNGRVLAVDRLPF